MKITVKDYYQEGVIFRSVEQLQEYVAMEIAEFVRDNMSELNNHPMDYDDHYSYIIDVYNKWQEKLEADCDD